MSGPDLLAKTPVKIGVAGLTHGHVGWILGRQEQGDIEIVGIAEQDQTLANARLNHFGLSMNLWYDDLKNMLEKAKPEAVCAFGNIYQHLEVVRLCAPLGIHVMVEKPLSFSMEHAREMEKLAKKYDIQLLTNYETTWYPSNHRALELVQEGAVGDIRKIVIHDGHPGPKEIGVGPEFLEWLVDPALNGGGAIIDFGCYGANLATWLMDGEKPLTVTAVTQQIKPEIYKKVDDEATIVLTYPEAQVIIQASWNWPFSRKDMEVYGQTGYIFAKNSNTLLLRQDEHEEEIQRELDPLNASLSDPFSYLAGVIRGEIDPTGSLSSLGINMIVVEILEAALTSSKTGITIKVK